MKQSRIDTGISPLSVARAEAAQLGDKLGRTIVALGEHGAEPDRPETQYSKKLGHETSI